uniref:NADH-ubiquinone oxidoreductase chain 2 n=1 Tax=Cryptonome barbada TaxID=2204078 RepID=A0A343YV49_9ANNE|nr:NADH dehydrogenase subunit 2 [Cryptonome barbada]AWN55970.1 NADH dehydrogenase subunit 2 [Cryptonome barbada]
MNSILPSTTIFSSTLITSTFIALSSSHWLLMWMALELNLLSFIPLITSSSNHQETEAAIKYFMAQTTGSALLLFGVLLTYSSPPTFILPLVTPMVLSSLLLKIGAAPLHFWFPNVMASLSWVSCLILSTWQKIIPISILISLNLSSNKLIMVVSALSSLIGGIGGMNQTFLRPLLAYSSIGHLGWVLGISVISLPYSLMYFLIYCTVLTPLILILNSHQLSTMRQSLSIKSAPQQSQTALILTLLSLGGLPPLFGFLPKWLALEQLTLAPSTTMMTLALLAGALMNLFYYLNIAFSLSLPPLSMAAPTPPNSRMTLLSLPALTLTLLSTPILMTLI